MRAIRAAALNTIFYAILIAYMVVFLVSFLLSRETVLRLARQVSRLQIAAQRLFGIDVRFRGLERLPEGGFIIAAKHQSMWETFALIGLIEQATFVYKKELDRMPLFGAYLRKLEFISIDRSAGQQAMTHMNAKAKESLAKGRRIIVFPEGTRRPPGAEPKYKFGIAAMYDQTGHPVVPVVLNSGVYWSNFFWRGQPGRVVLEILPPIAPGMERDAFFAHLVEVMEAASDRLLVETAADPVKPEFGEPARKRLAELAQG